MSRDWRAITFEVPGDPRGKGRPRFTRSGHAYTDEKTAAYENLIRVAFKTEYPHWEPTEHPVRVFIQAHYTPPGSWSKKKRQQAIAGNVQKESIPDVDNISKAVLDGLNGVAWHNDSKVITLCCSKSYAAVSKLRVEIQNADWTIIPHLDWKLDDLRDEDEEITDADLQQAFADGTKYIMEAYGLTEADLNEREEKMK